MRVKKSALWLRLFSPYLMRVDSMPLNISVYPSGRKLDTEFIPLVLANKKKPSIVVGLILKKFLLCSSDRFFFVLFFKGFQSYWAVRLISFLCWGMTCFFGPI